MHVKFLSKLDLAFSCMSFFLQKNVLDNGDTKESTDLLGGMFLTLKYLIN